MCRKELCSRPYKNTITSYCLCHLLQAGAMKVARGKEKHLIIINKKNPQYTAACEAMPVIREHDHMK